MFFLGGLNTILPHLIYLSVIWTFLLIGLSGRLRFPVIEQTSTETHYSVQTFWVYNEPQTDQAIDAESGQSEIEIDFNRQEHFIIKGKTGKASGSFCIFPDLRAPPLL